MRFLKLTVALVSCFAGLAIADSQVTIYGQIEEGVLVNKPTHRNANVGLSNQGDRADFIGIRGNEDLGGGNSVGFDLEEGFDVTTGSVTQNSNQDYCGGSAFTREASLNIKGDWGRIDIGRLGTFNGTQYSTAVGVGWAFGTGFHLSSATWPGLLFNDGAAIANNAISYQTPFINGFKLNVMYSNSLWYDDNDYRKWSDNNHYYAVGLTYRGGPLTSTLTWQAVDWKGYGTSPYTGKDVPSPNAFGGSHPVGFSQQISFGAQYDLGTITPMFDYTYYHSQKGWTGHKFGLSGRMQALGGTIRAGVRYMWGKNKTDGFEDTYGTSSNKGNWLNIGLGYTYPISKRTEIPFLASWAKGGQAFNQGDYRGYAHGKLNTPEIVSGYQFYLGIRHVF